MKLFLNGKDLFDYFYEHREKIDAKVGVKLDWDKLDDKKASSICTYIPNLNYHEQSNYNELMNKTIDLVVALREAFTPFLNKYTGD